MNVKLPFVSYKMLSLKKNKERKKSNFIEKGMSWIMQNALL